MRNMTGLPAGWVLAAPIAMPAPAGAESLGTQLQVRLTLQDRCEIHRQADNARVARCSAGVVAAQSAGDGPVAAAPTGERARSSLPLPRQARGVHEHAFVF